MSYIIGLIPGVFFAIIFSLLDSAGINELLRNLGFIAFGYLCLSLSITPLANILKNNAIRPYRKVFGVLAFFFALGHGAKYFYDEYVYTGQFIVPESISQQDVFSGIIAGVIMGALGITSLNYLHKKMGKYWNQLHSLVFPLFCIVALHIAFASRFDIKYMILILAVVYLRVIAYVRKSKSSSSTSGKYICVPCGYVYDPALGDPDGGIPAGTKFEDIPDNWVCPECGVTKADFIAYDEESVSESATVEKVEFLNPVTVELVISLTKKVKVIPGQFAKILLTDSDGQFSRSYSVVHSEGKSLTFCIKLAGGRSNKILKNLKAGESVGFGGIFGQFTLKNTKNKKVFIATGTGLSPIINMLENADNLVDKELYFGVATKEELFYEDKIAQIPLLKDHISLSKEEVKGYHFGRIDISGVDFTPETEFYICGNPMMVTSVVSTLTERGYKKIYTEKFT